MRREIPLMLLLACGTIPVAQPEAAPTDAAITLHGDTRFDVMERHLVELACEQWRKFSANGIRLRVVWDLDEGVDRELPRIVRTPPTLTLVADADARARAPVCGWTTFSASSPVVVHIIADDMRRCGELYPVVLHELGHVAGLDDVDVDGAVMSWRRPGWTFKRSDKVECVRVQLCEGP